MMLRFLNKRSRFSPELIMELNRRWMSTVMSFGDSTQGGLGLPSSPMGLGYDAYEASPIPGLPPNVSTIAAGHYHSLAVTSQGHVWAWGRNTESQLGRGPDSPRETWNEPQKVEKLDQVRVRAASASGVISAAIGDDGSLWVWGKSKRGQLGLGKDITEAVLPARVESLHGQEILKVSLGWGHALAVTKDGKLFGWGYYADGRLGQISESLEASPLDSIASKVKSGEDKNSQSDIEAAEKLVLEAIEKENDMPIIWEPTLIKEVHDVKIVDVACGLDHSLILCCDGTLLSGGSNVYGQLGRAKEDLGLFPVDIKWCPVSIASGLGHSLAVCKIMSTEPDKEKLHVATWGWNQNSQLGREGPENTPLVVDSVADELSISVSGGRVHSLAVTGDGAAWAWGCGKNGRLGPGPYGDSDDEAKPKRIDSLYDYQVLQAVAGFDHSLALVADRRMT